MLEWLGEADVSLRPSPRLFCTTLKLRFSLTELISAATFQEAVLEGTQRAVTADWRLEWVLRYSIIVKSRGIIKAKGYLVSARKASS